MSDMSEICSNDGSFDYTRVICTGPKFISFAEAVARGESLRAKTLDQSKPVVDPSARLSLIDGSTEISDEVHTLTGQDLLALLPRLSPRMNLSALTQVSDKNGILG